MSIDDIRRRDFVALTLAVLLAPARLSAEPAVRRNTYEVDIGILYHMLTFHLEGNFDERVDRGAGRYEVRGAGQGSGIANRLESSGVLLDLTVTADPESRAPAALVDFSRFTSWARQNRPARVVFDDERRPTLITGSMILGSSVAIRLG